MNLEVPRLPGPEMRARLSQFLVDDSGQDLIEYALLTAFIGLAGAAVLSILGVTISNTYGAWNTNNNGLWNSPDPGAAAP